MHDQACPISKQPELKATAVVVAPAVSVVKPVEQSEGRLQRLRRLFLQPSTSEKAASRL
jgi:ferredoxin-nitrate reductase